MLVCECIYWIPSPTESQIRKRLLKYMALRAFCASLILSTFRSQDRVSCQNTETKWSTKTRNPSNKWVIIEIIIIEVATNSRFIHSSVQLASNGKSRYIIFALETKFDLIDSRFDTFYLWQVRLKPFSILTNVILKYLRNNKSYLPINKYSKAQKLDITSYAT